MKQLLKHILCSLTLFSSLCAASGGAGTTSAVSAEFASSSPYFPLGNPLTYDAVEHKIIRVNSKFAGALEVYLKEKLPKADLLNIAIYEKLGILIDRDFRDDDFPKMPDAVLKIDVVQYGDFHKIIAESTPLALSVLMCDPSSRHAKLYRSVLSMSTINTLRMGHACQHKEMPKLAVAALYTLQGLLFRPAIMGFSDPSTQDAAFKVAQQMLLAISAIIEIDPGSVSVRRSLENLQKVIHVGFSATGLSLEAFLHKLQHKL